MIDEFKAALAKTNSLGLGEEGSTWSKVAQGIGFATSIAGAYHGYKRNCNSILWGLGWGIFGYLWPVAIPFMAAQGKGDRPWREFELGRKNPKLIC